MIDENGFTQSNGNRVSSRFRTMLFLSSLALGLWFTISVSLADIWTFETPSENIQCTVGEDFNVLSEITCTIIQRAGPPALPKPGGCNLDWGHTFSMKEKGPAEILCVQTDRTKGGFDRAEYGVTGEFGGFICHSSRKGLKCSNQDGHGFFLSRAKQSVF
ncbi:DUF6636 domain-containing protein [Stappia sp. BW2]|uniref:DUF6636 domain-containing protein n=1 Tax=Stappia sp. BW2 TaxID=2592622 RepID=UPI00257019AA|nr:DUF6636 domain-containing protein [Stappia sp. BW2]